MYRNSLWQATRYGLACIDGNSYEIGAECLKDTRRTLFDWPLNMSGKNWGQLGTFIAAFAAALAYHLHHYK